jgi:hypothetical protein
MKYFSQLYVYEEVVDLGNQFFATSSLYREVSPKYLITIGHVNDEYVKYLIDTVLSTNDTTATVDTVRSLPANMFLLSLKEYCMFVNTYCNK